MRANPLLRFRALLHGLQRRSRNALATAIGAATKSPLPTWLDEATDTLPILDVYGFLLGWIGIAIVAILNSQEWLWAEAKWLVLLACIVITLHWASNYLKKQRPQTAGKLRLAMILLAVIPVCGAIQVIREAKGQAVEEVYAAVDGSNPLEPQKISIHLVNPTPTTVEHLRVWVFVKLADDSLTNIPEPPYEPHDAPLIAKNVQPVPISLFLLQQRPYLPAILPPDKAVDQIYVYYAYRNSLGQDVVDQERLFQYGVAVAGVVNAGYTNVRLSMIQHSDTLLRYGRIACGVTERGKMQE